MRFTPVLLVFLAILIFFFYIDPAYKEVQGNIENRDNLQESFKQAQDLKELQEEKFADFNAMSQRDKERLKVMISSEPDRVRLFNNISSIGTRNGVEVTRVNLSDDEDTSRRGSDEEDKDVVGVQEVSVGFTVETNYANFLGFLEDVERSLQIMDVTRIDIKPGASAAGSIYAFDVELTAYSL